MQMVARQLRNDPTASEDILWQAIRHKQLDGRKFRRQVAIGPFVVDFYCASERLAVEVDGSIHDNQREADASRQALIESLGIRFVRLTANQVEYDLPGSLQMIRSAWNSPPFPNSSDVQGNTRS
ncbi:MAG: endonuclease domain-containing protein [Anaerolineae bacterium]|nr:endonuclease domain-containing protein [Anaerolineae bacterium]